LARPLESLVFVAPLLLIYQVGSIWLRPQWANPPDGVVAFQLLRTFFELFGTTGQWMPGLAVVAILLGAHIASRQPWKIRLKAVALHYAEAVAWAAPLLFLCRTLRLQATQGHGQLGLELVLGVGAGVYEELVFRLVLMSVVVILGQDLLRCPVGWTLALAVAVSAVTFAAHHHPPIGSEPFEPAHFFFRGVAGAYLGGIFLYRGYGPAAGTHVVYNVIVIALLR